MSEERPTKEALEMQRRADEIERQIVRFTNIDSESFTHSFRGISNSFAPGASQAMRLPEADHLAIHLARKIISRNKRKLPDDKVVNLWTDAEIEDMKKKIISPLGEEEGTRLTPDQAHTKDLEALNKKFPKPSEPTVSNTPVLVTKKDVIADLEKRGVKVDVSLSREELLAQLMDLEAKGIE